MPEKSNPQTKENLSRISRKELTESMEQIVSSKLAVWRENIDGLLVTIPVERLEQFLGEHAQEEIAFYIERNWQARVSAQQTGASSSKKETSTKKNAHMDKIAHFGDVEKQTIRFKHMSIVEREEILDNCLEILHRRDHKKIDVKAITEMVEVIANTFYINNANLEENVSSTEIAKNPYGIFTKTEWIIKLIIEHFREQVTSYKDLKIINEIEAESPTINHMNKVFLWFINFCLFYNDYIDDGLVSKKLRRMFKDIYLRYYKKRMPDMSLSIERIFKGGIRRIDIEKELPVYAIGALLSDIGKLPDIDYHDSLSPYNENLVKKHVLYSYNMIVKAKEYPFTIAAMAAFHHELYSGKHSYNFTRPLMSKITNKRINEDSTNFFITYDENEFKNGMALAFFPCKLLEVIDIFDALVTKKKKPVAEALLIMKKEFIALNLRIDPLLFEFFLEFMAACGLLQDGERQKINDLIY